MSRFFVTSAAAVVFAAGILLTYVQARPASLGWWGESLPVLHVVLTAVIMFIGIVFGGLFRRVSQLKRSVRVVNELRRVLASPSFVASLCVSPFVFMSVYAVVSAAPGDPASYLLAFQNGFFCESIFNQMRGDGRLPPVEGRAETTNRRPAEAP